MPRYYTRVCNFYYGKESKNLVKKKNPSLYIKVKEISFDQIEVLTRKSKKKIFIHQIKNLPQKVKKQVDIDIKKIKSKKKIFLILIFKIYQIY